MFFFLMMNGCAPSGETLAFCPSPTAQRWEPLSDAELLQFPDDALTTPDATSPTGLRVDLHEEYTAWMLDLPDMIRPIVYGIHRRTGFARLGGVLFRFTDSISSVPTPDTLRFVDLSVQPPQDIPYQATLTDGGRQLVVQPLRPLSAAAQHAVVLLRGHQTADGQCISPAPTLQAMLDGEGVDDALSAVAERYAQLPEQLGVNATDISAATVFTTHDDFAPIQAQGASLKAIDRFWEGSPVCNDWGDGQLCTGQFVGEDFRGDEDIMTHDAQGSWTLDVDVYLPAEHRRPAPVVVFGHGINSSKSEAEAAAEHLVTSLGVAVVAMDAMEHGSHPAADPGALDAMAFLGIRLTPPEIDGLVFARNLVQTNLDRMQMLSVLRTQPDLDGDGRDDVDMSSLGYLGISLGGMLGTGLLAMEADMDAAVLPVSGAHLGTFAVENEYIAAAESIFVELLGDEAAWQRVLLVGQANMDPADPGVAAAHVIHDRLDDPSRHPDLLVPVCAFDETVPVPAGHFMARSLGIPHVPPVVEAVEGLSIGESAPLVGNVDERTAGFFQLDRISTDTGVEMADHWSTPWSVEGALMTTHFFSTWLQTGTAEIIDPYAELNTPPL